MSRRIPHWPSLYETNTTFSWVHEEKSPTNHPLNTQRRQDRSAPLSRETSVYKYDYDAQKQQLNDTSQIDKTTPRGWLSRSHWKKDNKKDRLPHGTRRSYSCDFPFQLKPFSTTRPAFPPHDSYGPNPTRTNSNSFPHRVRGRQRPASERQTAHKINIRTGNCPQNSLLYRDCQSLGSKGSIYHPASQATFSTRSKTPAIASKRISCSPSR